MIQVIMVVLGCIILCYFANKQRIISDTVPAKYFRPSMDYYIVEAPLVRREIAYDANGNLSAVTDTDYDEYNRLTHRHVWKYDSDNNIFVEKYIQNYTYDKSYMYLDTMDPRYDYKIARKKFDLTGEEIHTEFYTEEEGEDKLISYSTKIKTKFEKSTRIRRSWVDDYNQSFILKEIFDERGNVICRESWMTDEDKVSTFITEYKYGSDGKILSSKSSGDGVILDTTYTYNNKLLTKASTKEFFGPHSDINGTRVIEYEYDSDGKLVKETKYRINEDGRENEVTYIYEYEQDTNAKIPLAI